ncbi:MBOAT family O-acyltransferase [Paenibacillus sp. KN14-4R]|uniref:MBOAT family O-acyltransferase n=1 Tax=Paenibacillus sp. KN14-4R TaxID=3445773 RepID=UPI003F9F506B
MLFHSPNFLVFFILLLIPYFTFRKNRLILLAIANAVFYGFSGIGILLLFVAMCLITFVIVHVMKRPGLKWTFWIAIALNLANLIFFKYSVFALTTIQKLAGTDLLITQWAQSSIVVPIGISFYTFEFLSYLIDVRRGHSTPTRSFVKFWIFVSTFPHLIAGPIMRGDELIPQLNDLPNKRIPWSDIQYGVYMFLIGMVKKVVIADTIATVADEIFVKGTAMTGTEAWIGATAFAFQIYYDFSAYTDMAVGLGYILGLRFMKNFNAPYLSASAKEFWDRWHMTLSRWIKDYIYIGLGGNRKGAVRTYVNLFAAMLISGLWHGALWTYVIWGAIWGALLVIHRLSLKLNRIDWIQNLRSNRVYHVAAVFIFFQITIWTWVFFRAHSMTLALDMTRKMLHPSSWLHVVQTPAFVWICGLFLLHILEYLLRKYESTAGRFWHAVPFPIRSVCYLCITLVLIYYMKGEKYGFIYFQF